MSDVRRLTRSVVRRFTRSDVTRLKVLTRWREKVYK
jgi:hypothetical protein